MRLAQRAFVAPMRVKPAAGPAVDALMSICARAPHPIAPASPGERRPGRFTTLVILALACLLCLAPLLHAHPADEAGPAALPAEAHPVGIHLPEQTRAPVFLAADEDSPERAITIDSRALATIVVAESHRRDGSPTPPATDRTSAGPPCATAAALPILGAGWPPAVSFPSARVPWPPYFARPPPASV
jgi:hypothetical protein